MCGRGMELTLTFLCQLFAVDAPVCVVRSEIGLVQVVYVVNNFFSRRFLKYGFYSTQRLILLKHAACPLNIFISSYRHLKKS